MGMAWLSVHGLEVDTRGQRLRGKRFSVEFAKLEQHSIFCVISLPGSKLYGMIE